MSVESHCIQRRHAGWFKQLGILQNQSPSCAAEVMCLHLYAVRGHRLQGNVCPLWMGPGDFPPPKCVSSANHASMRGMDHAWVWTSSSILCWEVYITRGQIQLLNIHQCSVGICCYGPIKFKWQTCFKNNIATASWSFWLCKLQHFSPHFGFTLRNSVVVLMYTKQTSL